MAVEILVEEVLDEETGPRETAGRAGRGGRKALRSGVEMGVF